MAGEAARESCAHRYLTSPRDFVTFPLALTLLPLTIGGRVTKITSREAKESTAKVAIGQVMGGRRRGIGTLRELCFFLVFLWY